MCDSKPIRHADLKWDKSGQSGLSGDLMLLFKALDKLFVNFACDFPVKEHLFPSLIPVSELKKVDYLHSFPQHATFPVHMQAEHDNLQQFRKQPVLDDRIQLTELSPVEEILTPAACYHCYIHYQSQSLQQALYLSTQCRCFRQETYYTPLERQNNFSMRELVCIGNMDEIQDFIAAIQNKVDCFIQSIALPLSWEVATDAFFDPLNNPKYIMQKVQPNKTEMMFKGQLAIGSINLHRNYFGEAFAIHRDNTAAHSTCVAFGLERWIAAILRHFGTESSNWPLHELGMCNAE